MGSSVYIKHFCNHWEPILASNGKKTHASHEKSILDGIHVIYIPVEHHRRPEQAPAAMEMDYTFREI